MFKKSSILFVSFVCVLFIACQAQADIIDLTAGVDAHGDPVFGTSNNAYFYWVNKQSTGTGVIDPFIRLQANGTEQGYNSNYRDPPPGKVQFDEDTGDNYNHALLYSSVHIVNLSGTDYLQFLLDINQSGSASGSLLSLDVLEIYQSNDDELHDYDPITGAWGAATEPVNSVYSLAENDYIKLNYSLNPGQGGGDMFAYIPASLFNPAITYIYFYSKFGVQFSSNAGFEEWAILDATTTIVPVPGAVLLGMLGLGMAGFKLRRFA